MTHYKRKPLPIDAKKSRLWAVSALAGGGVGYGPASVSLAVFDLVNRETGRAHRLTLKSAGLGKSLPVTASFSASPYGYFKTTKPVNFYDFDGIWMEVGEVNVVVYAWNTVKFKESKSPLSAAFGYTEMDGRTWALPNAGGQAGITEVLFSDGQPLGDVQIEIRIDPKTKEPTTTKAQFRAMAAYKVPSDALFDFDKHELKQPLARWVLQEAGDYIKEFKGPGSKVIITGHTDSIGSAAYNMALSIRRAQSVAKWLVQEKYCVERDLVIEGKGETKPIEPNKRADGGDNPYGREKNRRVEIVVET
jgi:outer membrane protein OmpA-like peptidoglycan-associated protein